MPIAVGFFRKMYSENNLKKFDFLIMPKNVHVLYSPLGILIFIGIFGFP
jgi:hypothetical protein